MGVVYHAHFLDYFEAARTEAFRALGLPYRDLEARGVMLPVVDVNIRYRRPARYDDALVIETYLTDDDPQVRLPTRYVVRRTEEARTEEHVLVEGKVTLCFVDAEHRRPMRAPQDVRQLLDSASF